MARRGENIYKRKDGRWEGRYKSGVRADGTARYSSIYGKTYAEVKGKLSEKRSKTDVSSIPKNLTVNNLFFVVVCGHSAKSKRIHLYELPDEI